MDKTTTFSDLVREAFIEPLRSVLIVDDQYPTWDEILNECLGEGVKDSDLSSRSVSKTWHNNPVGPINVINQFRAQKPGFIIDIHDALRPSSHEQADHLHQSDLLVLDYNLEGAESGLGGAKARSILQSVLSNNHFNLVVVHTGEHSLEDVFFDCLLATMASCTSQFNKTLTKDLAELDEKLDAFEIAETFDRSLLSDKFGSNEYLGLRHPSGDLKLVIPQFMKSEGELAALSTWAKDTGLKGKDLKTFLYWAIREFEKPKLDFFVETTFEGLTWKNSAEFIWLRTVRGFVTFVEKGPNDLLERCKMLSKAGSRHRRDSFRRNIDTS